MANKEDKIYTRSKMKVLDVQYLRDQKIYIQWHKWITNKQVSKFNLCGMHGVNWISKSRCCLVYMY